LHVLHRLLANNAEVAGRGPPQSLRRAFFISPAVLTPASPDVFGEIQRSYGHGSKIDVMIRAPT
jgi:hypothetical protein